MTRVLFYRPTSSYIMFEFKNKLTTNIDEIFTRPEKFSCEMLIQRIIDGKADFNLIIRNNILFPAKKEDFLIIESKENMYKLVS